MNQIELQNVCKVLKGNVVLDDINMTVTPGKIYGLKGKNGCGKTMLMRVICGLILPSAGKVVIDGKVLHKDIAFPRSIGALIENPAFLKQYTGYRNLELLGKLQEEIQREDIVKAMESVALSLEDDRSYGKYSLGMRQKLGIANAILGEPDIIILDEPINAIDEESVAVVKQTLVRMREAGKLVILACHDSEELYYLSDVVYLMKEGRIMERTEVSNEAE
ncbi:MAG: ATP-binding cassette domain-containing protein [Clostridium sp.]|nr:ATP-binding cassette domain-containing protein [Clostridium sp.]